MYSIALIEVHFWLATVGIVLYAVSMWVSGIMQGLMWRAVEPDGSLTYTFVESVKATYPYYYIRLLGGLLYLGGMLIMAYNVARTITGGAPITALIPRLNAPRPAALGPVAALRIQESRAEA
jgi:cytochrome c oxidase cbb3-type subunit 1